jgi:mono/diheme cytochrome c family protein
MRFGTGTLLGLLIAVVLLIAGRPPALAGDEAVAPVLNDPAVIARGRAVYAERCAACHGANLEGQPNWRRRQADGRLPGPPHDASGHTWHHSDKQLFDMIKNGTAALLSGYPTDMPAYKDILSDADVWAVISFIESRWPADIRERQSRLH